MYYNGPVLNAVFECLFVLAAKKKEEEDEDDMKDLEAWAAN